MKKIAHISISKYFVKDSNAITFFSYTLNIVPRSDKVYNISLE